MIDYKYFDLFWHKNGSVDKDWKIEYDGGVITDEDMFEQSIELTESLCSEQELRFGSCEASCLKFKIGNVFQSLMGKWITSSVAIDHHEDEPLMVGRYKVLSDKLTSDRMHRDIIAYDAMYDIINADVAAWYNSILPNKDSTVTMKQFRESFIRHFGLTEILPKIGETASGEPISGLVNDGMTVERTIDPEQISGKDVITAICEINGCFGHIGRDGKFHYIYLPQNIQGLYPADDLFPDHAPDYLPQQQETGHLYPQASKAHKIGRDKYIKVDYEDYVIKPINKVQIRNQENDIGGQYPEEEILNQNAYIIQDNFLVYGKSSSDLRSIAEKILGKIKNIVYRPFSSNCIGNLCFEVGDPVRFSTKHAIIEGYILSRSFKGIQASMDSYSAKGEKERVEKTNSVQKSIIQLKGKTNILIRSVEENRVEMRDIERGLSSRVSLTASQLRTEISDTSQKLQSQITQNKGEIDLRVRKDNVIASINLSSENITLDAKRIDLNGLVNSDELVSKFATITTLKTDYMEVKNWTSGGYIKADRIDVSTITAKLATANQVQVMDLLANDGVHCRRITFGALQIDTGCKWQSILVGETIYTVLCK